MTGVLKSAKQKNIPVAAFCGDVTISEQEAKAFGLDYADAISKDCKDLEEAILQAYPNLVNAAYNFALLLKKKRSFSLLVRHY